MTSLCDDNTLLGKVKTMYSVISSMSQQTITPRPAEAAPARVSGLSAGLLALAAGIAAFLLGTVIVTELVTPRIEFSLFVGLPVGFVVGVVTAVLVATGSRSAVVSLASRSWWSVSVVPPSRASRWDCSPA